MPVSEQQDAAVGARHAESEARRRRHQTVAMRPFALRPGRGNGQRVGGMDLIRHKKVFRRDAERARHAGAVFRHGRGIVAGADPAIERRINALRHPASPGEKGVGGAV
jgi:hypothetical protein